MNYQLEVRAPYDSASHRAALAWARALLVADGHRVSAVFFFERAVDAALSATGVQAWAQVASEHRCSLWLCAEAVQAAQQRPQGEPDGDFQLAGLVQYWLGRQQADRHITFYD